MRYQISYLIKGDAKAYHENLSNTLASIYRLKPVNERIDPHLTLKSPFETDSIFEVEEIIEGFVERAEPQPITLKGFSRFEDRLIYMDMTAPDETHTLISNFQDMLLRIPWISFRDYEKPVTLHATLCYPRTKEQADEIFSKLTSKEGRSFDLMLDNITILKRGPQRWETFREYKLG